jgi:hypothetical protein
MLIGAPQWALVVNVPHRGMAILSLSQCIGPQQAANHVICLPEARAQEYHFTIYRSACTLKTLADMLR